MANIIQPFNSKVRITPFSQRLLQYGIEDSKIYLSKATNTLLTAFTYGFGDGFLPNPDSYSQKINYDYRDSCILDGLSTTWSLSGNILTVTIAPGTSIVDSTMLVFPQSSEIDLDLSSYGSKDACGKIIVSINFQWVDSIYEMPPKVQMNYLDLNDNFSVEPNGWWQNQDKLVINVFEFNKTSSGHVDPSSIKSLVPVPCQNIYHQMVVIKDYPYEIAPLAKFWYNFLQTVEQNYTRKVTHTVPGGVDPTGLPESKISIPVTLDNLENIDLLSLSFNLHYDSTILENPTIETGSAAASVFKNATINTYPDSGLLEVHVSGNNMLIIPDGTVAIIHFDIIKEVPQGTPINFTADNFVAVDKFAVQTPLNGVQGVTPQIYLPFHFSADRPSGVPSQPDIDYDLLWKYGTPPLIMDSKRYFYSTIDISTLTNRTDNIVQCYINNLQIQPAFVELIDSSFLRIWMPQNFIEKDPIPDLKVIIIG